MKTDQRDIMALSFESNDEGYVYYHYRWSSGIPVTAEEREAYLAIPAFGSRHAWRKSIAGRKPLPPRSGKVVQMKLLAAMPRSVTVSGLVFGMAGIMVGLGSDQLLTRIVWMVGGVMFLSYSTMIIVARRRQQ